MKNKHTPGPWILSTVIRMQGTSWQIRGGNFISETDGHETKIADIYSKADLCLISSAPEMLKILEDLVGEITRSGCQEYMNEASAYADIFNNVLETARNVISKARGET
jgi:hypothetical protein